jgi:hypothetical protein
MGEAEPGLRQLNDDARPTDVASGDGGDIQARLSELEKLDEPFPKPEQEPVALRPDGEEASLADEWIDDVAQFRKSMRIRRLRAFGRQAVIGRQRARY